MRNNPFLYFEHTPYPLERGNVLISVPLSGSYYFERTVVLLIDHSEEGSFGIVLNRYFGTTFKEAFKLIREMDNPITIFSGGPVEVKSMYVLHTYGNLLEGSVPITDNVYFDAMTEDILDQLLKDVLEENSIRVYFGYTGWEKGQLEAELENKMWVVGQFQQKLLFNNDDNECWKMAVKSLGEQYTSWFDIVRQPILN